MVGDNKAKLIEDDVSCEITKLCGKIEFITSALLTKYVDLVISVDSGVLHAAGCFDTPKIALLGNSSAENITKHFKNCTTIESDCMCSPCFKTIFEIGECPIDKTTNATLCMGYGISPFEILDSIDKFRGVR
jgi:heptosyltransferase-2